MDCSAIPDSAYYNCSNLWGINCTSILGFDFVTLWNITQIIQRRCPSDPRLWLSGSVSATSENAAITGQSCKEIAGEGWQKYPGADIWVRLTTWKFPLLQLVASSPRPPLGFAVEGFVILHLLGDPIGTIKDLLGVISNCHRTAGFWRRHLAIQQSGKQKLSPAQIMRAWKAFAVITISYDEWGKGEQAQEVLEKALDEILANELLATNLETFLQQVNLTADALAADRATRFLPIMVAQGFFVSAVAVAIAKITSNTSSTSFFLNVEAHSIAFTALYFWILPAVFLSSVIGVSQTQKAIPRILRRFQTGINHEISDINVPLPNFVLSNDDMRILSGGVYSWKPDGADLYESKELRSILKRNITAIAIVVAGTATAMLVSGYVPPEGWQPRHCAQAMILLTWVLSFFLTSVFKIYTSSPSYNIRWRFRLTLLKDALATIATMGGIIVTQFGVFNRCDSYTRWDRVEVALPEMPEVAAKLDYRMRTVYPAIIFVSIGLQMFIIPLIIALRYRHALLVFLRRDDDGSSFSWLTRWLGSDTPKTSNTKPDRRQKSRSDAESLTSTVISKDGIRLEEVELLVDGDRNHHNHRTRPESLGAQLDIVMPLYPTDIKVKGAT